MPLRSPFKTSSNLVNTTLLFLVSSLLLFLCLLLLKPHPFPCPRLPHLACDGLLQPFPSTTTTTSIRHLVFGIAASARSFPRRRHYLRRWWDPALMRGFVFLDSPLPKSDPHDDNRTLPPVRISSDASRIPYTFHGGGLRSAVRVARVVKDLVAAAEGMPDVRWVVLGDDDTVFFPANLAAALGRRDWERWHYVGGSSEAAEANERYSFDMAFGGGGFAVSWPLARVLARVMDSCLVRYAHLYGSDARVFSCLAELGIGLTRDLGFHQVDLRGDIFGMLSAHPLTPLVSLHHLDYVDPIFPGMNRVQAVEHLFEAVKIDPGRVLQQTVCYDRSVLRTVSVSWGYAVQVFEGNLLLPDILSWQRTFTPWRRSRDVSSSHYMFNTREVPKGPCKRPAVFFLESVVSDMDGMQSNYSRHVEGRCPLNTSSTKNLKQIKVFSQKLVFDNGQLQAPRRHCCDILPSSVPEVMEISIRKCKDEELIAMYT